MTRYEFTVIPAPQRGEKARGAKSAADRYALTLEQVLNQMGAQGWDYVRAETLPSEERSGLTSRSTVWNNVLVFRREVGPVPADAAAHPAGDAAPAMADAPAAARPFSQPMRALDPPAPADPAA